MPKKLLLLYMLSVVLAVIILTLPNTLAGTMDVQVNKKETANTNGKRVVNITITKEKPKPKVNKDGKKITVYHYFIPQQPKTVVKERQVTVVRKTPAPKVTVKVSQNQAQAQSQSMASAGGYPSGYSQPMTTKGYYGVPSGYYGNNWAYPYMGNNPAGVGNVPGHYDVYGNFWPGGVYESGDQPVQTTPGHYDVYGKFWPGGVYDSGNQAVQTTPGHYDTNGKFWPANTAQASSNAAAVSSAGVAPSYQNPVPQYTAPTYNTTGKGNAYTYPTNLPVTGSFDNLVLAAFVSGAIGAGFLLFRNLRRQKQKKYRTIS
jgi:hypothetical protein